MMASSLVASSRFLRSLPVVVALLLSWPTPSVACEPVAPMTLVFAGGATVVAIQYGAAALALVIGVKCFIFARTVTCRTRTRAARAMFMANVYSTIPGILMAVFVAVPADSGLACLFVFGFCFLSCRSLVKAGGKKLQMSAFAWCGVLIGLSILSGMFLGMAQNILYGHRLNHMPLYWLAKWASVTLAIVAGLILTTAFELSVLLFGVEDRLEIDDLTRSCVIANVAAFFVVAAIGAIAALPARWRSRNGLI